MDRRSFLTALPTTAATIGFASEASAANEDVGAGCEGAVLALKGWIDALARRDFDFLEQHLASDFVFTTAPMKTANGTIINVQKPHRSDGLMTGADPASRVGLTRGRNPRRR